MEVFIVRVWPEPGPLRGRVEHVRSGAGEVFLDAESLCAFMTARRPSQPASGIEQDVLTPPAGAE